MKKFNEFISEEVSYNNDKIIELREFVESLINMDVDSSEIVEALQESEFEVDMESLIDLIKLYKGNLEAASDELPDKID